MVTAVVGNFKFRYVLSRMHAAGLGDTLGIALILAGCAVIRWSLIFTLKEALVVALLWVTSPAASHMIMKMELENGSSADGKKEGRKK